MFYYLKVIAICTACGLLAVCCLLCGDAFDGNFTSHYGTYGSYGACDIPASTQQTLLNLVDDQVDSYWHTIFASSHVSVDRRQLHDALLEGSLVTLVSVRLEQGRDIFLGIFLLTFLAAAVRRTQGIAIKEQMIWIAIGFGLGFIYSTIIVEMTALQNPGVYIQDLWTESVWKSTIAGIEMATVGLGANLLTTKSKKKGLKRLLVAHVSP